MSDHLREARAWWRDAMDSSHDTDLQLALESIILHLEEQESAPPLTEERVREIAREEIAKAAEAEQSVFNDLLARLRGHETEPLPTPIVPTFVPDVQGIHEKLDRILAWVDEQRAQAVGVTTVPGEDGA